jgi:hypothetical protein
VSNVTLEMPLKIRFLSFDIRHTPVITLCDFPERIFNISNASCASFGLPKIVLPITTVVSEVKIISFDLIKSLTPSAFFSARNSATSSAGSVTG